MKSNPVTNLITRLRQSRSATSGTGGRRGRWAIWLGVALIAFTAVGFAANYGRQAAGLSGASAESLAPQGVPQVGITAEGEGVRTNLDGSASAEKPATGGAPPDAQPWDRMIIRTATLQVQVESVAASLDKVRVVASSRGGYVTQSDSRQEGDYLYATLTIQVPAAEFDAAITALRKLGVKPATETITSSDVTEEYTDLQSQLRNLEQTEGRILALMGKAERIEDILNLDREMRNIRGEIERIQGRLTYLSKRAEMSTITVSLSPAIAPVTKLVEPVNAWDPAEIVMRAWNASLDMLASVANFLLTGVVFLWWALPLVFVGWLLLRPRRRAATSTPPTEA
jgi:hypothetical protein